MHRRPSKYGFLLLLVGVLTLPFRCTSERAAAKPARAIILVSVDTLRSDHLPAYGYQAVETPSIDALRRDGVLFLRCYAHIPLTLPSHGTIFTGLLPSENGLRDGYATGAAVSAYSLRAASGISRGFDLWDDAFTARSEARVMGEVQRDGDETIAIAKAWIRTHKESPFFFFLHLYEPHTPYDPPEPYRNRYGNPYDGEIARSDALLGDFFEFLRDEAIYDEAAIIFLPDHGEGLNDHGEDEHGILLYREAIQGPLILKLPRGEGLRRTVTTAVQLIDIFPTLVEFAGVPEKKLPSGAKSLTEAMAGSVTAARPIFSGT